MEPTERLFFWVANECSIELLAQIKLVGIWGPVLFRGHSSRHHFSLFPFIYASYFATLACINNAVCMLSCMRDVRKGERVEESEQSG